MAKPEMKIISDGDVVVDHAQNYADFDAFYVAVAIGDDGREGLIAFAKKEKSNTIIQPVIAGSSPDKNYILDYIQDAANKIKRKVRVIEFSTRKIVKECLPKMEKK